MLKLSGLKQTDLVSTSGPSVTLTAGADAAPFLFGNVEEKTGSTLVDHMVALNLRLSYTFTQAGGGGTALFWDNEVRAVLDSMKWTGTDYGTVMDKTCWRGATLPYAAYIMAGWALPGLPPGKLPAANAAYARIYDIVIPVPGIGLGDWMDHAMPVRFFKNSQFTLSCAAASVGTGLSTGSSIASMTAALSAFTVPLDRIQLGCPVELREYVKASQTSGQFTFDGVGNNSGLDGTESGSGMIASYLGTTANGVAGAVAGGNVTQLGVPERNIAQSVNVSAFITACIMAQNLRGVYGSNQDINTSGAIYAENFFPYILGSDRNQSGLMNSDLAFLPLGNDPAADMRLSKVKHFPGGSYPIQLVASGITGDQRLLTLEAKRFSAEKKSKLLAVLRDTARGGDLAARVLGPGSAYFWDVDVATPKGVGADGKRGPKVSVSQARYLPSVLKKAA